jgi:copper transport protein
MASGGTLPPDAATMPRALLIILLWLFAAPAAAHAVLLATEPADLSVLEHGPARIELRFNENVIPLAVQVLNAERRVVAGPGGWQAVDDRVTLALPPLTQGSYIATWRVLSADSHPVVGSISFGIRTAAMGSALVATEPVWTYLRVGTRFVLDAALLGVGGLVLFAVVFTRQPLRRLTTGLALGALIVLPIYLFVHGLDLAGGALAGALPAVALASTSRAALLWLLAVALVLVWLRRPGATLGWTTIALLAGGFALTGHAATAPPPWLAAPVLALHAGIAAFWIGALPALWHAAHTPAAADLATRFSTRAMALVPVLLVAGLVLGLLQTGGVPSRLVTTDYGLLLLAKIAAVASALALAAYNRWRLLPRLRRGEGGVALRRSIGAEIVILGLVVALTSALGGTPPARTLAHDHSDHADASTSTLLLAADLAALVSWTHGRLTVEIVERDGGRRLEPLEVVAELTPPDNLAAPLRRVLTADGGRTSWQAPLDLPLAGAWALALDVLVTDFRKVVFTAPLDIPPQRKD